MTSVSTTESLTMSISPEFTTKTLKMSQFFEIKIQK